MPRRLRVNIISVGTTSVVVQYTCTVNVIERVSSAMTRPPAVTLDPLAVIIDNAELTR